MIHYLHFIAEFWFSTAAKVVGWFAESLFLKKLLSRRTTMALTKRGFVMGGFHGEEDELELGLGSVRLTRGLGRKRILISSSLRKSLSRSAVKIPVAVESPTVKCSLKRQRSRTTMVSVSSEKSRLESLPRDLLIQVICCVDYDDLKSLIFVSKSIKKASLKAKRSHFAYTTPKKTRVFRNSIDLEEISDSSHQEDDIEPPNAPNHYRWTKAKRKEQLSGISVALFT